MLVLAVSVVVMAGCSSGGDKSSTTSSSAGPVGSTPTSTASSVPALVAQQMPGAKRATPVDGHDVWVDEPGKKVFVDDCDVARRITAQGQRYGPSARDASGNFTPGYAFVCPS